MSQRTRIASLYAVFAAAASVGLFVQFTNFPARSVSHSTGTSTTVVTNARSSAVEPLARPIPEAKSDFGTPEAFVAATRSGRRVIFVDADFSSETVRFRPIWQEFRRRAPAGVEAQTVVPGTDWQAPEFVAVMDWIQANSIHYVGGYKTFGGAGLIVWTEDGEVRDHSFCSWDNSVDSMTERTRRTFFVGE
jgi:hypothetical protein